jgi:hypothetical protein
MPVHSVCGDGAEAPHSLRRMPPLRSSLHNRDKLTARATTVVARIELLYGSHWRSWRNGCEWESLPDPPYPRLPLAHRLGHLIVVAVAEPVEGHHLLNLTVANLNAEIGPNSLRSYSLCWLLGHRRCQGLRQRRKVVSSISAVEIS